MSDSSKYPSPNDYADWQSWAATLIGTLEASPADVVNLPSFVADASVARGGYPAALKGDMIWINEGGVRKLAIFDGQKWIKYSPDA